MLCIHLLLNVRVAAAGYYMKLIISDHHCREKDTVMIWGVVLAYLSWHNYFGIGHVPNVCVLWVNFTQANNFAVVINSTQKKPFYLCGHDPETTEDSHVSISQILNRYFTYHDPTQPATSHNSANGSHSEVKVTVKTMPIKCKSPPAEEENNNRCLDESEDTELRRSPRKQTPKREGAANERAGTTLPVLRRSPRKSESNSQSPVSQQVSGMWICQVCQYKLNVSDVDYSKGRKGYLLSF